MIHLSSQKNFMPINDLVTESIQKTHKELESLLGPLPMLSVQVKLMTPDVFTLSTGVPSWTNALYFDDTIIIPINQKELNEAELVRSVRHEFTHAVIHNLTDGKCPGWLDEGLAQFMEGTPNPLMRLALMQWLEKNPPVPFQLLQKGFTKLNKKFVAPAYAQSLWAANILIHQKGFLKIRNFFDQLKKGTKDPYTITLDTTEAGFEESVSCGLKNKGCMTDIAQCSCPKELTKEKSFA